MDKTRILCSCQYIHVLGDNPQFLASNHLGYGSGISEFNFALCYKEQISVTDLCYVWGSPNDMLSGKTCVVRDEFGYFLEDNSPFTVWENDDGWDIEGFNHIKESATFFKGPTILYKDMKLYKKVSDQPFKTLRCKEGKILVIGTTQNGNTKIKLFK